jgi:hypothetical protein
MILHVLHGEHTLGSGRRPGCVNLYLSVAKKTSKHAKWLAPNRKVRQEHKSCKTMYTLQGSRFPRAKP